MSDGSVPLGIGNAAWVINRGQLSLRNVRATGEGDPPAWEAGADAALSLSEGTSDGRLAVRLDAGRARRFPV